MEAIKQMVAPVPRLKVAGRSDVAPIIAMDVLSAANERAAAGEDVVIWRSASGSSRVPSA